MFKAKRLAQLARLGFIVQVEHLSVFVALLVLRVLIQQAQPIAPQAQPVSEEKAPAAIARQVHTVV